MKSEPSKGARFTVEINDKNSTSRKNVENFISKIFYKTYSAKVKVSYPTLINIADGGKVIAALGLRGAEKEKLFLENYLKNSLTSHLSKIIGNKVKRREIAEVGSLASDGSNGITPLIFACANYLKESGYKYIVFTGTNSLCNYFSLLGFNPIAICKADPAKIKNAKCWGTYYDTNPKVIVGDLLANYPKLIYRSSLRRGVA